jgi:hypothetical protein
MIAISIDCHLDRGGLDELVSVTGQPHVVATSIVDRSARAWPGPIVVHHHRKYKSTAARLP